MSAIRALKEGWWVFLRFRRASSIARSAFHGFEVLFFTCHWIAPLVALKERITPTIRTLIHIDTKNDDLEHVYHPFKYMANFGM